MACVSYPWGTVLSVFQGFLFWVRQLVHPRWQGQKIREWAEIKAFTNKNIQSYWDHEKEVLWKMQKWENQINFKKQNLWYLDTWVSIIIFLPQKRHCVCKNLLQIGFINLPHHEDKNCQQQEQCNDCQEDDPPGHFGKIYNLPLKEHRQFYLKMVTSHGRGQLIRMGCRDLV